MARIDTISEYQPLLPLDDEIVDAAGPPDDRSGACYLAGSELVFATEVALATGRPLLLRGAPGSGKSSWASYVARNLNWRYHEVVVTSDTELFDLYYRFDAVRRLQDAQRGEKGGDLAAWRYITPGAIWFGFDWSDAQDLLKRQGRLEGDSVHEKTDESRDLDRAIILVDELDKADPSLPNGLLDTIASRKFHIEPLDGKPVKKVKPAANSPASTDKTKIAATRRRVNEIADLLIIFTTNEERDLPEAFLRRCIVHQLPAPDAERLQRIAWLRRGRSLEQERELLKKSDGPRYEAIQLFAEATVAAWQQAKAREARGPSTAEFLDLVAAWEKINFDPTRQKDVLLHAMRATFQKAAVTVISAEAALDTALQVVASMP